MQPHYLLVWMPRRALCSFAIDAQAQVLNRDELRQFGGTYMSDRGNNASLRLEVLADTVRFCEGNRRVAGTNARAAYAYFGQNRRRAIWRRS